MSQLRLQPARAQHINPHAFYGAEMRKCGEVCINFQATIVISDNQQQDDNTDADAAVD